MKHLLLLIFIVTISAAARSADLYDGYVVMTNNDTVKCKVKSGDFSGVTVINEQGEKEVYRIKDEKIIAFGYFKEGRRYDYFFLNLGSNNDKGFYQRTVNGPKYVFYGRPPQVQGGSFTYVLYKQSGEYLKFDACSAFCPWKKKLREFLSDDENAGKAIDMASPSSLSLYVAHLNWKSTGG